MSKIGRSEDAFTGLEAAIVLIAFIVVAAVFSYVVLGAGFFTTQKSQEVVHTGVAQASSNLELSGPVIVGANATNKVGNITFYLQLAAGGAPVDMEKVVFTLATNNTLKTFEYGDVTPTWYVSGQKTSDPANQLLERFEFVEITIIAEGNATIVPNQRFTVEVKPHIGAAYPVQRNAPPYLESGKYYEVY